MTCRLHSVDSRKHRSRRRRESHCGVGHLVAGAIARVAAARGASMRPAVAAVRPARLPSTRPVAEPTRARVIPLSERCGRLWRTWRRSVRARWLERRVLLHGPVIDRADRCCRRGHRGLLQARLRSGHHDEHPLRVERRRTTGIRQPGDDDELPHAHACRRGIPLEVAGVRGEQDGLGILPRGSMTLEPGLVTFPPTL